MGELVDIQIPLGLDLENDEAQMVNGLSGSNPTVAGGVYCVDETIVSTAANGGPFFTTMKAVATANLPSGLFAVCPAALPNGVAGTFRFNGVQKCRVLGTTDVAIGDPLIAVNAQNYLVLATVGAASTGKCIAKALEANATDTTPQLIWVLFKGISGLSTSYA